MHAQTLSHDRTLAALHEALAPVRKRLGATASLPRRGGGNHVADATTKVELVNPRGRSVAVVLCASERSPNMVARGMSTARHARGLLGSALGSVILEPLDAGEIDGRSYVVLPLCRELRRSHVGWKLQRRWLTPFVLRWLHATAQVSSRAPGADFHTPLLHMRRRSGLPAEIQDMATKALARLDSGRWTPRHCLDHNDLWKNNILLPPRSLAGHNPVYPFVVIDWVGANPRGHGMYDLIRFCKSMRLPPERIARELGPHCAALGCDPEDAGGHLVASLGWLGMNLEEFPPERFVALGESCCRTLREAQASG